jgi:hypothetical protein
VTLPGAAFFMPIERPGPVAGVIVEAIRATSPVSAA